MNKNIIIGCLVLLLGAQTFYILNHPLRGKFEVWENGCYQFFLDENDCFFFVAPDGETEISVSGRRVGAGVGLSDAEQGITADLGKENMEVNVFSKGDYFTTDRDGDPLRVTLEELDTGRHVGRANSIPLPLLIKKINARLPKWYLISDGDPWTVNFRFSKIEVNEAFWNFDANQDGDKADAISEQQVNQDLNRNGSSSDNLSIWINNNSDTQN